MRYAYERCLGQQVAAERAKETTQLQQNAALRAKVQSVNFVAAYVALAVCAVLAHHRGQPIDVSKLYAFLSLMFHVQTTCGGFLSQSVERHADLFAIADKRLTRLLRMTDGRGPARPSCGGAA